MVQYQQGPIGGTVAFSRINNAAVSGGNYSGSSTTVNNGAATDGSGQPGVSAGTAGYQRAQAQQRFAVAGGYQFSPAFDISVTYTNVQYIPGVNSLFTDEAVFNTAGTVRTGRHRLHGTSQQATATPGQARRTASTTQPRTTSST